MVLDLVKYVSSAIGLVKGAIDKARESHPGDLVEPKHPAEMYQKGGAETAKQTGTAKPYSTQPKQYEVPGYATTALLIPLIIGVALMTYLAVGIKTKPAEAQLSPATNSLVVILFIFVILYSIFLMLFFMSKRKRIEKGKSSKKYSSKRKR